MTPVVSICCVTYNHKKFIVNTIESFVMQETNFDFEILIHDDASNDGTQDILKEYEKKYTDKIKVIYQKVNQYNLNINPLLEYLLPTAKGKYIALCEGDDYWTDTLKLQKQVDLLELNKEVAGCYHICDTLKEDIVVKTSLVVNIEINSIEKLFQNWSEIHTLSLVFKNNETVTELYKFKNIRAIDLLLCCLIISNGSLNCLPYKMGVYRKHSGGISNNFSFGKELLFKSSNMLFLHELLTDERYKKDWNFIKMYLSKVVDEIEHELVKANNMLEEHRKSIKKSIQNKVKGFIKKIK